MFVVDRLYGALNLNAKKLALFRQFSAGLFGTKNTNGWLHMCRRPSVLKQGASHYGK